MVIVGIIVAILIFSIVIIIHEFGHFYMARKFGVKVLEFGLGIPPKAKELFTDKLGTKYTLNWLPLGGFVRLNGEEIPHSVSPKGGEEEQTKFYNKTYFQKSVILLAGVFMNFMLASVIFSVLFFIGIKPLGINDKIPTNLESRIIPTYKQAIDSGLLIKNPGIVVNPISGSIAEKSNLKKGDIILEISTCKYKMQDYGFCSDKNGKLIQELPKPIKINNFSDFKKILKENIGKKIAISGIGEQFPKTGEYDFYPLVIPEDGKIGVYISENIEINKNFEYKYGILNSIKYGFTETYIQSVLTLKGLKILVKKIFSPEKPEDRQEALNQMSGPIGIVDFVSTSLGAGIIFLSIITAVISINLGIFNLLPIPALDGGRWFLLTINTILKKIFGDKIDTENFENLLHILFFIILIALSILIGYNDIIKIINR